MMVELTGIEFSGGINLNIFDLSVRINGIQFTVECDIGSPISHTVRQFQQEFEYTCIEHKVFPITMSITMIIR